MIGAEYGWLESDFSVVFLCLPNQDYNLHWLLHNRWVNCLRYQRKLNLGVLIFTEREILLLIL